MTNRRREIGDTWGPPTESGAKTLGDPWKSRRQDIPVRKDHVQDTRYGLTPLGLSMPQREEGLSKEIGGFFFFSFFLFFIIIIIMYSLLKYKKPR